MRFIKLALFLACFCSLAAAQTTTTFTGTIKDLTNTVVTSGSVTFTLQPGADTTISGSARFTPQTVTCGINGSGLVKANDLTNPCVIVNNTALTPAGTSYRIQICPAFACTSSLVTYAIGGTVDITTLVPTPGSAVAYSLLDTLSNQTIGGNKAFTGSNTFCLLNASYVAGSLCYSTIQSAITAASTTGIVVIPSVYAGTDSYTNPNNILILDQRRGSLNVNAFNSPSIEAAPSSITVPFAGVLSGSSKTNAAVTGIFIGDSITAGTGPPSNQSSWAMAVTARLQEFYGNAGNGFCDGGGGGPTGCFPVLAGAWTGATTGPFQTVSPAFNDVQRGTNSATATLSNIVGQASVDVLYYTFTDTAGFDIKLDGVSQGTFGASTSGSFVIQKATISGIPSDGSSHTILVTAPASGAMYLLGFMQHTGLGGYQMWNTAQPGAVSGAFASANQLNWLSIVPNPAFALVALGQNDFFLGGGSTPATLVANHQAIYNQLKALNIPEVLLITEPPQASDSCVAYPCPVDFVRAEIAWAQSLNIPIINIFARWGSYAAGNAQGLYADSIHPNQAGANDIALAFMQRVFPTVNENLIGGWYFPVLGGQTNFGIHMGTVNGATIPFLIDGLNNPGIKISQLTGNHTAGSSTWTFSNDGFASFGTTSLGTDFSDGTGHMLLRSGDWWIGTGGSHNVPCALLEVGASCQFSVDSSGNVKLNNGVLLISPTAPTIATHFNTSGDSIVANGTASFSITVGTGAGTSTGVLTLPTGTTGWNCWLTNQSRADVIQQTGSTTTSATFTNFGTTFAATNWTNSDVLRGGCKGY